jgi:hypothetical protein
MKALSRSGLALCLVTVVMLAVSIISLSGTRVPTHAAGAPHGVLVKGTQRPNQLIPLYDNANAANWASVCSQTNGSGGGSWIIADVAQGQGPGTAPNSAWASVIDHCYDYGNASVIGYVWTNYGRGDLANIETQVADWYKFYPGNIAGIFFDGVSDTIPSTTTSNRSFYQTLAAYVHKHMGDNDEVVFNFGANPGSDWMLNASTVKNADIVVTFEGSYDTAGMNPYTSWVQASWELSYPADDFAAIVYNAPDTNAAPQPASACATLTHQNLGYVYVGTWFAQTPYLPGC